MLRNARSVGVVLGSVVLVLTGIQGAAGASTPARTATVLSAAATTSAPDARLTKLVTEARHQTTMGISYLYAGGHGSRPAPLRSHVDCSGLVRELYHYAFGVDIGGGSGDGMIRTSGKFTRTSSPVPGDVVLLGNNGSAPAYHSGIYIGIVNGERAMVGSPTTGQNIKVQQSRGGSWGGDLMGYWHYKGATAADSVVKKTPALPRMRGAFDSAAVRVGSVSVSGWAIDPQRASSRARIHVLVDGRAVALLGTTTVRADVNRAMRVSGAHGFRTTVGAGPGRHTICVNARSAGSSSVTVRLGCKAVLIPTRTRGSFDRVSNANGSFRADGWALDPRTPRTSTMVRLTSDGHVVAYVRTTIPSPNVNRALKVSGVHGFHVWVPAKAGRHTICALSLPRSAGSAATSLGCRVVLVR
jgi:hypothetical protein